MANVPKLTPEKEEQILDALREKPTYAFAARRARINRRTLWVWRHADPDFDARVQSARDEGFDAAEDKLIERGMKDDTTALIFLLKGWRRSRYGDRMEHTGKDGKPIQHQHTHRDLSAFTDDEIDALAAMAERRKSGNLPS